MTESYKPNLFGAKVLGKIWQFSNLTSTASPLVMHSNIPEALTDDVAQIAWCRRLFYNKQLEEIIRDSYKKFSNSNIDFFNFLKNNIGEILCVKEMYIFDKFLMSLAFVVEMCFWCKENRNSNFILYAPPSWALYFEEELSKEFFYEGGWERLKWYSSKQIQSKFIDCIELIKTIELSNGNVDIVEIFDNCLNECDLKIFKECIQELLEEFHELNCTYCIQCYPLFNILNYIINDNIVTINNLIIEGFIQVLSKMFCHKEIEKIKSKRCSLKCKLPYICNVKFLDDKQLSILEGIGPDLLDCEVIERSYIETRKCQKIVTQTLMDSLYAEDSESSDSQYDCFSDYDCLNVEKEVSSESCPNSNFLPDAASDNCAKKLIENEKIDFPNIKKACIFCCRLPNSEKEHWDTDTSMHNLLKVKFNIMKTVHLERMHKHKIAEIQNAESEHLHTRYPASSEADARGVKDALRMFMVLGLEPGRSTMLDNL